MTSRVTLPPKDFQKMCLQAERDHESKKLIVLMERVKRQIAERASSGVKVESPKPPAMAVSGDSAPLPRPSRSSLFER